MTKARALAALISSGKQLEDGSITYSELTGTPSLGTAASLDVGTGANNIVQLDGSGQMPAVDGSQLTGIAGYSLATALALGN